MRLRNISGSREFIVENEFCIDDPESHRGSWKKDIFHNNNPIHLEIGMGKGLFLHTLAEKNPDINYLGIEKYSSVLYRACEKRVSLETDNLFFLRFDATYLETIFSEGEIDRIYLNFSDPWPKDRHAKRRLTSPFFLALYDKVLASDGYIQFKTDNRALFDYSVEVIGESDIWHIDEITYDLHGVGDTPESTVGPGNALLPPTGQSRSAEEILSENVMTEYEQKFTAIGNPICRFVISR